MKHGQRLLIGTLVAVVLTAALALIAAGGEAARAEGTIIYVDADATGGGNNGSSWANAFLELYDALDEAEPLDKIWVAAGTYKPTDGADRAASFQMVNGVEIYGGFDPTVDDDTWEERDWVNNETILSGDIGVPGDPSDNSYHVFYHSSGTLDSTAILDGFTVTGGNADGAYPHDSGGGMFNWGSSPTLIGCTFEGNSAVLGGGLYNDASSPSLAGCAFANNSAGDSGGGMRNDNGSSPVLAGCTFTGNSAEYGGGMLNWSSSPTLNDCTFEGNSAGDQGGGMLNYSSSSPAMTNCTFTGNIAGSWGGGMHNWLSSAPTLVGCTFAGNSAGVYGGGMMNYEGSSPVMINCIFWGNGADYGGGMLNYTGTSPVLTNCTFWGNSAGTTGGAIANSQSSPTLTNCILWGNSPDQMFDGVSTPVVTHSDLQGGYPGDTNIDEDPLFVNVASGNVHLGPDSPCIDAGDSDAPDLPDYDFDGDDRVIDGNEDGMAVVDMGADEAHWYPPVYLPVVLRGH